MLEVFSYLDYSVLNLNLFNFNFNFKFPFPIENEKEKEKVKASCVFFFFGKKKRPIVVPSFSEGKKNCTRYFRLLSSQFKVLTASTKYQIFLCPTNICPYT